MQGANRPRVDPAQLRKSLLTWGAVIAVLIVVWQVGWGTIWQEGLIRPMLNTLLFLYTYLGRNFIVAIAAFTLILRLLTFPLQFRQIQSSRRMAALQPQVKALQEKYNNDKERLVQEQQKLYREAGVSPLGGCLPTLIQFPIWIGLYQSINSILADTPIELIKLGTNVYDSFTAVADIIPIQSYFLGMNLAKPDPTSIVLPVLVAGSMYLQQKMMTQPGTGDPQQASMNQTMQLMMPLMFGYFTTQFASGLAIYFVISNVIGIFTYWLTDRLEGPVQPADEEILAGSKRRKKVTNGSQKRVRKA